MVAKTIRPVGADQSEETRLFRRGAKTEGVF